MLSLDDPTWNSLRHAYGPAGDVPGMLRALARHPAKPGSSVTWTAIWSALCHQGTVYEATYAAVPHLVAIAASLPPTERKEILSFVGAVAASNARKHAVPAELVSDFHRAQDEALSQLRALLPLGVADWHEALYLLRAVVALEGRPMAAAVLECLADGELIPTCPSCGIDVCVTVADLGWVVDVGARDAAEHHADLAALAALEPLASAAGQHQLEADLRTLRSAEITCPTCGEGFGLYDRMSVRAGG